MSLVNRQGPWLPVAWLSSTLVLGCQDETDPGPGGAGGTGQQTASSATQTADSSSTYGPLPPECDPEQSFAIPGCRDALRAACLRHLSEEECLATPPALFREFKIFCGWTKVVRFSDPATCEVDSVSYRCEAGLKQDFVYYYDACEVSWTDIFTHWSAVLDTQELVKHPYGDPIGPEQEGYYRACGDNFSPPEPQPICSCTEVACAAE